MPPISAHESISQNPFLREVADPLGQNGPGLSGPCIDLLLLGFRGLGFRVIRTCWFLGNNGKGNWKLLCRNRVYVGVI